MNNRIKIPDQFNDEAAFLIYLGLSAAELKKIWWYRSSMYVSFKIPKSEGKDREINAPNRRLKYLQRRIKTLLDELYIVRNPVHGFVQDRSVKTNAASHMNRRHVVNLDIKDFFPSITENRITGLLRSIGVERRVAEIIARICCRNGTLPQGAPSSPVLSNMICFRLDNDLRKIAYKSRSIYTRYADDITFSAFQAPTTLFSGAIPASGRFSPEVLAKDLLDAFANNGFSIHPEKAHYADRNARRMVTGLKINEVINIDRRYIRNLRAALNVVEKEGHDKAQAIFEEKYNGKSNLALHLRGKLNWIKFIKGPTDPTVRGIISRFNTCYPKFQLEIKPTQEDMLKRSVWIVEDGDGMDQGSCFFLKNVGLVTAAHCVQGMSKIEVYHPSKPSNKFSASIDKIDRDRDIALLKCYMPETEYFELEQSNSVVAALKPTKALGYPDYAPGDSINIRTGTISSLPVKSAVKLIEVTQVIYQGMSGGPLLDDDNKVIGINHKGRPDSDRNLAVHIAEIGAILK